MAGTFVQKQQARVAAAEELERIANVYPDLFDEFVLWRQRCSSDGSASASHLNESVNASVRREDVDPRLAGKTVHEAVAVILEESGHPMRTPEITEALRERGFGANNENLRNAVFTALARKTDLFVKVHSGVWALNRTSPDAK